MYIWKCVGKWSVEAVSDVTYFGRYNVSLSDVGAVFPGVSWPCVELGVGLHHLYAALQLSVCNDDHLQWRTRSYHLPLPAASLPTVHSSSGWLCRVRFRSLLNKPKSFNKTHKMQIFLDTPESFPLMMDAPSQLCHTSLFTVQAMFFKSVYHHFVRPVASKLSADWKCKKHLLMALLY